MGKKRQSHVLVTCRHCGRKFHPSAYHAHDQDYCTRRSCRQASRRAASKRYREKMKTIDPRWREKEAARVRESRRRNKKRETDSSAEAQLERLFDLFVQFVHYVSRRKPGELQLPELPSLAMALGKTFRGTPSFFEGISGRT